MIGTNSVQPLEEARLQAGLIRRADKLMVDVSEGAAFLQTRLAIDSLPTTADPTWHPDDKEIN